MALNFPSLVTTTYITSQQALGGNSVYTTSTGFFGTYSYVHVFTSTGIFTVTTTALNITFLAVGGGGGGSYPYGGGGGAGGLVTGTAILTSASNYIITVGTGGAGAVVVPRTPPGSNGTPSSIIGGTSTNIVAQGGGGGAGISPGCAYLNGNPGGSGGGSPNANPSNSGGSGTQPSQSQIVPIGGSYNNYGSNGGTSNSTISASGGGGAGGNGVGGSGSNNNVTGGPGRVSSITGSSVTYGAGGRGGPGSSPPFAGVSGTLYTGNGGGSGCGSKCGGPGIVVLSYSGFVPTLTSSTNVAPYTTPTGYTYSYSTISSRWTLVGLTASIAYTTTPTYVSDVTNTSEGYFDLPSGTTAQRPANPQGGWIRFNTTINSVEYYSTVTSWTSLPFTS